ncbi:serine/threonine-protein kinase [uncultured Pseudoalteromonas sp.]|uniref:serine/threonine-protein kinase n=1 Tax=uncultured Pseudoalteromonas sp. TaxID=114053 RepID=UPI0030DC0380
MNQFKDALSCFEHLLTHHANNLTSGLLQLQLSDEQFIIEVKQLINAHTSNDQSSLFNDLLHGQLNLLTNDHQLLQLQGGEISHFRLEQLIGYGGMGAVYLATRNDGQLNQKVAIKLFYPSIVQLHGQKHVLQEAQYLAKLSHPNIASVLDVGKCSIGTYIIIQYIAGDTLINYAKNLSQKARLEVFQKVCDAVEYAHQNRVIHADLKPSNILVDNNGEPKLVDFGVARSSSMNHEIPLHNAYIKALSHEFASPEQLAGESLTTQADIYSLGRILEKLLIQPISTELQEIINKSLAPLPQQRFASADTLKQNIAAYLAHRPLLWFKHSKTYILGKFIRRSPLTAALITSTIAFLGVACISLFLYQDEQKQAAKQQYELLNFYQNLLISSTPLAPQGAKLSVSALLLAGVEQVMQSQLSPKNQQSVLLTVAQSLYLHGNFTAALDILALCDSSIDMQILKIKSLIKLNQQQKARILWQKLSQQNPQNSNIKLLGWLTKDSYLAGDIKQIKIAFQNSDASELKLELLIHIFTYRDNHPILSRQLILENENTTATSASQKAWQSLMKSSLLIEDNQIDQAIKLLDSTLKNAANNYHPLHCELAKLNHFAANLYAQAGAQLAQEQALNKAMFIYQQLLPNFEHELSTVLYEQYQYYLKERDYLQANNFLNKQLLHCSTSDQKCMKGRYESTMLGLSLRKYSQTLKNAELWLANGTQQSSQYYDITLAKYTAQYEQNTLNKTALFDIDLTQLSKQQQVQWLELVIKTNMFNTLTSQQMQQLIVYAKSNSPLAFELIATINKLNNNPHTQWLAQLEKQNHISHSTKNQFSPARDINAISETKRVSSITAPKHASQLKIGSEFTIEWDSKRLIGNTISVLVNHTVNYKVNSFDDFNNLKKIDWHPAATNLKNTGTAQIDPYHFMANGTNRFKLMLISDLGYWSLSDGFFSIASGKTVDNGLEHFLLKDKLVTTIITPKALDIYPVGQQKTITWNANKLYGQTVAMYVLHDDSRGIGDKQQVDLNIVNNRRWYQFAEELPNTGEFNLDPALFNGRGNNYKILIVSDLGYWSVSDKRFSVVNPL